MSERGSKKRTPPAQASQRVGAEDEHEEDGPEESDEQQVAPPPASFSTMTFDDLGDADEEEDESGDDEDDDEDDDDDGDESDDERPRQQPRMDAADLANQMLGSDRRGAKRESKHKPSIQYHCRPYRSDGLPSDEDKLIIPGSAAETRAELQQELVRRAPTKLGEWEIVVWEKTVTPKGQFRTVAVKTFDMRTDRIIPDEEDEDSSDDHSRYTLPIRPFMADEDDGRSRRRRRDDDDDDERSSMPQQPSMVAMLMQQQTDLIRSMMDRRHEPVAPPSPPMNFERILELAAKATPLVELFKGKDPGDKMFDAFDRGLQSARQMEKTPWSEIMQLMVVGTLMQNPNLPKDMVGSLAKLFGSKLGGEATEAAAVAKPKVEVLDSAPPVPALPDQQRNAAQPQQPRGALSPVDFRKGTCWAAMNGIFEAAMTDTELASRCQYTDFWAMRMWGEMPRAAIHDILAEKPEILCGELLDSAPNVYRWIASNFPESERNTPETQRHIAQTAVAWVADLQQEIQKLIQRRSAEQTAPAQPESQETAPQT